MRRCVVYIIGAYTEPSPAYNVHAAVKLADELWRRGFAPVIPHLSWLWDMLSPHPYEMWTKLDLCIMRKCDAVLWDREWIPGMSNGGLAEWKDAAYHDQPRFASVASLALAYPGGKIEE